MTDTFRALCAELTDELTKWNACYIEEYGSGLPDVETLLRRSEATLAVPEGREPASVVGELTDEELLRTYGQARRDHCYEGPSDDWPKRAERAATIAGLRAVEAAVIARRPVPAPPAEGEVAELVEWMKSQVTVHPVAQTQWAKRFVRIAELLQSFASPAALVIKPSPELLEQLKSLPPGRVELLAGDSQYQQSAPASAAMIPMEYVHLDFDGRIVREPSEEGPGGCWRVLNSRFVSPFTEFPTAEAACNALQAAHALPLPSGEVEE